MAFDPKDLIGLPFNFGEIKSCMVMFDAACDAWKNKKEENILEMRKTGKLVTVMLNGFLFFSDKDYGERDPIKFKINKITLDEWFGKYPNAMKIGVLGYNGCSKNDDLLTHELVPCIFEIDTEGNVSIYPANDEKGFRASSDGLQVGILSTTFSFVPNDDEDEQIDYKKPKVDT